MRLVTFFAHPDDAEIWTGGTLLKHSRRGDAITIYTFAERTSIRFDEAQQGARLLGAETIILSRDLLSNIHALADEVYKALSGILPHVVITHWHQDTHPEHRMINEAVAKAIVQCRIQTTYPRSLLACETYNSIGIQGPFTPSFFVDVSDVWPQKIDAIRAHSSQPTALWISMAENLGRLNGGRSGCQYAEAYMYLPILGQYHSWAFLPDMI